MGSYYGYPSDHIENDHLRLEYLTQAGPRIVGLRPAGRGENLLAETPTMSWDSPNGIFHIYGGHRLWIAPEIPARTYVPDDDGVTVRVIDRGIELTGACEPPTGIRKRISILLDPDRPVVEFRHRLLNEGTQAIALAPWAITQFPLGGRLLLPLTAGAYPPDSADAAFQPNRHVAFWSYTRIDDPRLHLADECLSIDARPSLPPVKVGCLSTRGWGAYLRGDVLLINRFDPRADQPHADRNTNLTAYCSDQFVELETLGPLVTLPPGAQIDHNERWQVIAGVSPAMSFAEIAGLAEA